MRADRYYGKTAKGYDAEREKKIFWIREHQLVKEMVEGFTLDIPFGTGRFVPIYVEKGINFYGLDISNDMLEEAVRKYPSVKCGPGSIYQIPFQTKWFDSVVCVRFMHLVKPDHMVKAMAELCRVAQNIIVSIRLGNEGVPKGYTTYTHDEGKFLKSVNRLIDRKEIIHEGADGKFFMFKFRPVAWNKDVTGQFKYHPDGSQAIKRIARVWSRRSGLPELNMENGKCTVEYWGPNKFYIALMKLQALAAKENSPHKIITTERPKSTEKPPLYIRVDGEIVGILDGRRRSNLYVHNRESRQVILIDF